MPARNEIEIFATAPSCLGADPESYLDNVASVSRWAERAGCAGILIYTDNSVLDPWLVAQVSISSTHTLRPLVAIQPVYMHPYSVAKMVTSLAFLYRRKIYLNMVAGGFSNDLAALGESTPHDKRYARLVEYTAIVKSLVEGGGPVTYNGEFYRVDRLVLKPPLPRDLFPGLFVSGSSDAGMKAARALSAVAVQYPGPPTSCGLQPATEPSGVRIGIIARPNRDEAWNIAYARFPEDRKGRITHELAMKVSDSAWHKQLSTMGATSGHARDTYWLGPFETSKSNCPYLVGDYDDVSRELSMYISAGYKYYILDIPPSEEELQHIGFVFDLARRKTAA